MFQDSPNSLTRLPTLLLACLLLTGIGCDSETGAEKANEADTSVDDAQRKPQASSGGNDAIVEEATSKLSGHERMVLELKKIHENNQNNPYFEGALKAAERRYASAKRQRNPFNAVSALYDLGREWTQKGDPDRALEVFEEMTGLVDLIKRNRPQMMDPEIEVSAHLAKATAAIRKGENENCINCIGSEGCLFPIGPRGVHRRKEGSTEALIHLKAALEIDPQNLTAIWLLNIAHMTLGTHPEQVPERYRLPADRLRSPVEFPRFRNIGKSLGIDTFSHAGGVVIDDFDGDSDLDLFVSSWATDGQCRYFRNEGDQGFSDQTEAAGLIGIVGGLNTRQIDFDNDGDPDVLMLRGAWLGKDGRHPNSLLRNDGGSFVDVAYETKIAGDDHPTQTAAVADYDLDGDLDIFVGNESEPDQLMRNDGGIFTDVAKQAGVRGEGFAKGAAWGDIDNDGDPDLFVSNMGEPNRLFRNNGDGTFEEVLFSPVKEPGQSFSCWFFDYDNDGNLDLFVAAYGEGIDQVAADYFGKPMRTSDHDRVFKGDGLGGFEDVTKEMGLGRISQTMGSNFGDLNNDGFLDVYLSTGSPSLDALQPNLMYLNQDGKSFVDVSIAGGFSHLQKGHAISFVDFDHDGDQDVFAELGGAYQGDAFQNALFENPGFNRSWLKLRLEGTEANRTAVGARVEVVADGPNGIRRFHRVIDNGSSFGSNPLRLHIGLSDSKSVVSVKVRWPGKTTAEVYDGADANGAYRLVQGSDVAEPLQLQAIDWRFGSEDDVSNE
ncbi:MAG: CRTAC1 family protein [Planctomycetota bacterium]